MEEGQLLTCIVALEYNNRVYIGGDSAGVAGYDLTVRADEKVFTNGEYVMGFTSSFRMGQLLRYAFDPPEPPEDPAKMDRFLVVDFIDEIRECFRDGGYGKIQEGEHQRGGTFLVGVRGKLYTIDSDFQVGKPSDGYAAAGCGETYALGSLHASAQKMKDPKARVRLALESAAYFSAGVCGPFVIQSL